MVVDISNFPQQRLGDLTVRRNDNFTSLRIDYVEWDFFIQQNVRKGLSQLFLHFRMFLNELIIHPFGVPFGFAGGQLDKVLLDRSASCLHIHHDSSRS